MICEKCGYENKPEAEICEFCKSPLEAEPQEKERTVWDRLFIINILTCSIVFILCFMLILVLYFFA